MVIILSLTLILLTPIIMASYKSAAPAVSELVNSINPEIYTATRLFMAELSEHNYANLNARRELRLIDEHLQNGTVPERLYRMQFHPSFQNWLEINRLFWPAEWSSDFAENIEFIVERLRSEYLEDIVRTSNELCQFREMARRYLKEGLGEKADEAVGLFNAYCRATDNKAAVKPRRKRWGKTRTL